MTSLAKPPGKRRHLPRMTGLLANKARQERGVARKRRRGVPWANLALLRTRKCLSLSGTAVSPVERRMESLLCCWVFPALTLVQAICSWTALLISPYCPPPSLGVEWPPGPAETSLERWGKEGFGGGGRMENGPLEASRGDPFSPLVQGNPLR